MKHLKRRVRPDKMRSESRKTRFSLGHLIYYFLLSSLLISVLYYFFADRILFQAEGIVRQDFIVIEASSSLLVEEVFVRPGEHIIKNQPLVKVQFLEAQLQLATIGVQIANLQKIRNNEIRQIEEARRLLPISMAKLKILQEEMQRFRNLKDTKLISKNRLDDTKRILLEQKQEIELLKTRIDFIPSQKDGLKQLKENYTQITRILGGGIIYAPVNGEIGKHLVAPGEVLTTGETLTRLFDGDMYVVVYLPDRYLFSVHIGDKVRLETYQTKVSGVIEEILPFSDTLPLDFQNSLRMRGRNRLARIKLTNSKGLTFNQRVAVKRSGLTNFMTSLNFYLSKLKKIIA